MSDPLETEIKLRVEDRAAVARRLESAGFRVTIPRQRESNTLYDTPERRLYREGMLIRLRQSGDRGLLTWKGAIVPGTHKSRPELETSVGSTETVAAMLSRLGYTVVFRYEKFRTQYRRGYGPGLIDLDETPIGVFLELEGPGDWIDATAAELGFVPAEFVLDSYAQLYLKDCVLRQVEPSHMVFPS